jgi:hypothetical protein
VDIQQLICKCTEEYDGSAWTAGGNLGTARYFLAGCRNANSRISFGGETGAVTAMPQKNMMVQLGQQEEI